MLGHFHFTFMTRKEQEEKIAKADDVIADAHSILLDVYYDRKEAGAVVKGDALTHAISLLSDAIHTLRDAGESPRYLAAWERKPDDEL